MEDFGFDLLYAKDTVLDVLDAERDIFIEFVLDCSDDDNVDSYGFDASDPLISVVEDTFKISKSD
jgi:hypothetical protein